MLNIVIDNGFDFGSAANAFAILQYNGGRPTTVDLLQSSHVPLWINNGGPYWNTASFVAFIMVSCATTSPVSAILADNYSTTGCCSAPASAITTRT